VDLESLPIAALAAVSAGLLFYALVYPYLSGEAKAEKRVDAMTRTGRQQRAGDRVAEATASRKKSVSDSLKDLDQAQKAKRRLSIKDKLEQAGLNWPANKFYMMSAALGAILGLVAFFVSGNLIAAALLVVIGALGIPNWILSFLSKRRVDRFINEFPNAIDIIIRGIKSGLPLGDCIRIIASEAREPLKSEFVSIVEAQTMGMSVADACGRLLKRMPVQEANFFVIVIQIQQKAGGNLAEALGNLSKVLRSRKAMKAKIQALSMEAKASAVILGALPFLVAVGVEAISPGFLNPLIKTQTGNLLLIGSAFWMTCGVAVMKKMINFDF
jgi:tight adherence protein B